MTASGFCRYQLRTTDMTAARAFYTDTFGAEFWGSDISLAPLPERAAAQGAPAHWLGHIGVRDVEATAARIAAEGGQQLGPTQRSTDGLPVVLLRDPFGAVMAVSGTAPAAQRASVAWHLLHTRDQERAFASYAELFGWEAIERLDLGPELGAYQTFAWDDSRRSVGAVSNGARSPHIHTHWLFFFPVADIEASRAQVHAAGGLALAAMKIGSGDLIAACDDPQGAAFGLYQFA